MNIGYARVSTNDGRQRLDLQIDALLAAGCAKKSIYTDQAAGGAIAERPQLSACLRALRDGDTLHVWKLDRLGRSLKELIGTVETIHAAGAGLRVLTGKGADIDTTTVAGRLIFSIFGALAEFEAELIRERTKAGLAAARRRGKSTGRPAAFGREQIRYAAAALSDPQSRVTEVAKQLGVGTSTIYRYVSPDGQLRPPAKAILETPAKKKPAKRPKATKTDHPLCAFRYE